MHRNVKSTMQIALPAADGALHPYRVEGPRKFEFTPGFNRVVYAAAHVVADPHIEHSPWLDAPLDWEATIGYRRYLWSLGLGVAEAMDTAQRGTGLDWPTSLELIGRSIEAACHTPGAVLASGAGTDQLATGQAYSLDQVVRAYHEQMEAIERLGGRLIIMASRALAAAARSPEDYRAVYRRVLSQAREPVILHWLGDMFDPALTRYWSADDSLERATDIALEIIDEHRSRIDGIKISLLDKNREIAMRARLPATVRMYTGDDFNYPEVIEGNAGRHSDALLGIFDPIAPAAADALGRLARGDLNGYREIFEPTVPLARHLFKAPTRFYKTGVVFLAWLNGHQSHFTMIGGQQSARSILHLAETFRLADHAGLLRDPERACARMRSLLAVNGVEGAL